MFRQNHAGSQTSPIRAVITFPDPIEAIAWSNHPCIGRRPLQVLAEILKDCGVFGWKRRKVVDGFVRARCQTRGSHVVTQDSAIHYLREKVDCGINSRIKWGMFS